MDDASMQRNVEEHHESPETRGEWALSVAALPGATLDEIIEAAREILHGKYRWTVVARLVDAGYPVVEDDPPHALVMLSGPMTIELGERLRALFGGENDNPYHKERKRNGGKL
jgi:hypothetical protein